MRQSLDDESKLKWNCNALLTELGLIESGQAIAISPLTGGVASDIAKVSFDNQTVCVKFALPKLKVEADWFAPVHRNAAEYAWLKFASGVVSGNTVKLYGRSTKLHGFAMEFLDSSNAYLWKNALLAESADRNETKQVGELLGKIHAASAEPGFDAKAFQNHDDFHALRLEPYLLHTANQHPDIAEHLQKIASGLFSANQVLVHGDVSPKNIMIGANGPVLLDAECATMGDACFDTAFCLNHLILKAIHLPNSKPEYLGSVLGLWHGYSPHIKWESARQLESRVTHLIPALMLARIDGKSPIEYLSTTARDCVRCLARELLQTPVDDLETLLERIAVKTH